MGAQTPSVLIVDDDKDTCANLKDILSDLGYSVDVAYDGPSALELIQRTAYDVALLDLKMPGMDGVTLYRRIKELRAGTVAIIVTAYASSETASAALSAGAWSVLSKPVNAANLLRLVGTAMDQPMVLIVDDDADLCENLWEMLREKGYRVCIAHNSGQAEQRLADRRYRVVLIDMKLNGASGEGVFRALRKASPDTRTILITGFRSEVEEAIGGVLAEGADAVCYKPFDVQLLLRTLEKLAK